MAIEEDTTAKPTEATSLLPKKPVEPPKYGRSVLYRALLCGFLVSLSFGVTQVPYASKFPMILATLNINSTDISIEDLSMSSV